MAPTLPLPVRIAAGVLATGLDRLRHLPQDLPAMSVTVAGQAARLSMRVQQEITELAGRGDELLSGITSRPTEHPEWARFDDEEPQRPDPAADRDGGPIRTSGTHRRSAGGGAASSDAAGKAAASKGAAGKDGASSDAAGKDAASKGAAGKNAAGNGVGNKDAATATRRRTASRTTARHTATHRPAAVPPERPARHPETSTADPAAHPADPAAHPADPTAHPADPAAHAGPPDLPGYDALRPAQLRARLNDLDAAAVERLLAYERNHSARAPFVTLLSNRITTLRSGSAGGPDA